MPNQWTATATKNPPVDVLLDVLLSDLKTETRVIFDGKMYWTPDRAMYVYFIPAMWRLHHA